LMDRYYKYKEVLVGPHAVETPRGKIEFDRWLNRAAFLELLQTQRDRGVLTDRQFEPGALECVQNDTERSDYGQG
jgi:hypothetical protein